MTLSDLRQGAVMAGKCGDRGSGAVDATRAGASEAAAAASLPPPPPAVERLGPDCLSQVLAWLPDPSAAAATCRSWARVVAADDFEPLWTLRCLATPAGGDATAVPCLGTRAVAWRRMRGRGAAAIARLILDCRQRRRQATLEAAQCNNGGGWAAVSAAQLEELGEEADAALMLEGNRPAAALLLLAGPYAQHLLVPLAARAGDAALLEELLASGDAPPRPLLLEGDASTRHVVLADRKSVV